MGSQRRLVTCPEYQPLPGSFQDIDPSLSTERVTVGSALVFE